MSRLMLSAAAMSVFLLSPAFAQDAAPADVILATVIGNTVQGSMADGEAYTEFYATDGVIKAADYTGAWTLEGDKMCFAYDDAPTCYAVGINGDQVTWLDDAMVSAGTGTILPGNPSNY
jgi:hypothetical protein